MTITLGPIKLSRLQTPHPRLDVARVQQLQAMYRGGSTLLANKALMKTVFPKYTYESPNVYDERCARAYYENLFALVINQISAGLAQDPARYAEESPKLDSDAETVAPKAPPKLDDYWQDLLKMATAITDDGSCDRSLDQVLRDLAVEGLVTGWAWAQCELPAQDAEYAPNSLLEQERAGGLRAYVVPWPTDCVIDWEDVRGRLLWVRTYTCETPAPDPSKPREDKLHVWTIWTDTEVVRYEVLQKKNEQMPGPDTFVPPKPGVPHTFGRVPWVRFDVSQYGGATLHVGDVIESLCRNYFNRQNGESFQWSQFYYQQLYEFLGPEIPGLDQAISDAQQDPSRAHRFRAPGQVHVRGAEDDAKFVGPDMSGADVGRAALQDFRDAILRVTAQMALAQDTSGAMLRRSADSKRQDSVAQEIVLGAIGKRLITMANGVAKLLSAGRGDAEPPTMTGYERFDVTDAEQLINQDLMLESIEIKSATFQREKQFQLAITRLGDNCTPEMREAIRKELEEAVTQDQLMMASNAAKGLDEDGKPKKPEPPFGSAPAKDDKAKKEQFAVPPAGGKK